jgi:hypothetical protein
MPSEFRRIMFTNNELIEAIHDHNQVSQDKLPRGMIVTCKPVAEADVAVRLELVDQCNGETHLAYLSPTVVAAALLRYCMKRKIPIPKKAAKSIEVHDDTISLNVRIEGRLGPSSHQGEETSSA